MGSDQPHQDVGEKWSIGEEDQQKVLKPVYFLPFDVQLQNTFCIEMIAKRFPVANASIPHINVGLEDAQVNAEESKAQIILHLQTVFNNESGDSPPFNIAFKIIGIFTYTQNHEEKDVRMFLEQGSLSILLPFARELLVSICTRLQIPPMILAMVQLAPHPSLSKNSDKEDDDK
jgi:preprotein translocase subunit SecB